MRAGDDTKTIRVAWPLGATVWITVVASVAMAVYPQGILNWIQKIFSLSDLFFR